MIRSEKDFNCETRENMRGGSGSVTIAHMWTPGTELKSPTRMVSKIVLESGCSIGFHRHENEEELFYILSGVATADDDGNVVTLTPGDTMLTGGGAGHSIANNGTETLEILATIMRYAQ